MDLVIKLLEPFKSSLTSNALWFLMGLGIVVAMFLCIKAGHKNEVG